MKVKITALTALLLCTLIACDTKKGGSSKTNSTIEEIRVDKPDGQKLTAPPQPTQTESKQMINGTVSRDGLKDESITVPVDKASNDGTFNTEDYDNIVENKFLAATKNPLSTFSIDVDEAAYSNVRRYLENGAIPPAGAVRIEEMINYFDYDYPKPVNGEPFTVNTEISACPWNPQHKLVHIGLQGKVIPVDNLPPSNMVFLVDVSGSMDEPNKLPLVQASMNMLVDQLREKDKV
ncbi:MAG: von Willebrand factor type A domain-containing protein, partial [Bacteroidota bacterium]